MFGLFKKQQVVSETCNQLTERTWQSILSNAEANDESFREAVAALNVKVICELAPLVRDRSRYEIFRHEAVGLALSLRDGHCRNLALKQVEGLHRRTTELSWPTRKRGARTQLVKKTVDQNTRELMRARSKTPLVFRDQRPRYRQER
jgi:hypothetical protein